MIPVHLWLPEAHVEAPTSGSVILAGVLLKLGTYGFIRFLIPLFRPAVYFFTPLVFCIAVSSILYTSFTAIRQTDFKRIIAYTSIAHLNFVVIGIFSCTILSVEGAILQSLSHGFVASSLFLVIGVIYDRYKTRIVSNYGGLASVMPVYASTFLFLTLANMGFPGTSSFVAEFLILLGSYSINTTITVIGSVGIILSGVYSLWLFNRMSYGNIKTQYIGAFIDLNFREIIIFIPLLFAIFSLGICPNIALKSFKTCVLKLFTFEYVEELEKLKNSWLTLNMKILKYQRPNEVFYVLIKENLTLEYFKSDFLFRECVRNPKFGEDCYFIRSKAQHVSVDAMRYF